MAQPAFVEINVEGEECWAVEPVHERNYLVAVHSPSPKVHADLLCANTLELERFALLARNVLIENNHVGWRSSPYSVA